MSHVTAEQNLELTLKNVFIKTEKYRMQPVVMRDISVEEVVDAPSVLFLFSTNGMRPRLMNQVFLEVCYMVIKFYSETPDLENVELAKTIIEKWHTKAALAGEPENPQATIDRIIPMLESGVPPEGFKRDSFYASTCSAIVNLSGYLKGWHFSDTFKRVLSGLPPSNVQYHTTLFNLGKELGYFAGNKPGVCRGVVMTWLSDCMVHEEGRYAALSSEVISKEKEFPTKVVIIKNKKVRGEVLTSEEEHIFQLLAFYETVALYQSPGLYHGVFEKKLNQDDIEIMSPVVSSKAMEVNGNIAVVASVIGVYTIEEGFVYFKALADAIDSVGYTHLPYAHIF